MDAPKVLLTGATGYVGGRLLHALVAEGLPVRCLARRPEQLRRRVPPQVEVAGGDVLDPHSLAAGMAGCASAVYLVHAMAAGAEFEDRDRRSAATFGATARASGLERVVYLGGLGGGPGRDRDTGGGLSAHLASRQEVGRILRESAVPTIELRASIIIGSGSLSFEMVRALVEKLPVMITPRWVRTMAQPIAIEDVVAYLIAALRAPAGVEGVFEIGGADRVSYLEIMREYARQRGLRRRVLQVPVLTPGLSSLWLGLVTPIYAEVGRSLIDGVRNETIVRDDQALRTFAVRPRGIREAIARALQNEDRDFALTRWSDALSSAPPARGRTGMRFGGRIVDSRAIRVSATAAQAFAPIRRIGGARGWYYADFLWRMRGFLDLMVSGPGLRRGRRDPERLVPGDAVDFWRVEAYEEDRLLRLAAEMRLPGRAWLQFEIEDAENVQEIEPPTPSEERGRARRGGGAGSVRIRQTAIFDPLGLAGRLYWIALYPIHQAVFAGMLRAIAREASAAGRAAAPDRRAGGIA